MKTPCAFLFGLILAAPVCGQQIDVVPTTVQLPIPVAMSLQGEEAPSDTLRTVLERSHGITLYTYAPDPMKPDEIWPVTGTNNLYGVLGVKYAAEGEVNVTGVLIGCRGLMIQGDPDTLYAWVVAGDGVDGLPNMAQPMTYAATGFTTDMLDTSGSMLRFTPLTFEQTMPFTGKFTVEVQTLSFSQSDPADIYSIYSNTHGDGMKEHRAYYVTVDQNHQMVARNLDDTFTSGVDPIDIDPMIIPIVERVGSVSGVEDYPTIGEVTLKGATPSPATDRTTISIALEQPADVEVSLVDMTGRIVRTARRDRLTAGEHTIDMSLQGIAAGDYLYIVSTGRTRLAGKLSVVR